MSFNPLSAAASAAASPAGDHLLRTLMGRLHLHSNSFLSHPLDDLLSGTTATAAADDEPESPPDSPTNSQSDTKRRRSRLIAKEEAKLEKEIIRIVLAGNAVEALKANSGQSVSIGEHNICVGVHEDPGSEYRVWEWHGHIMFFDDDDGYSVEYIYGNYLEKLSQKNSANEAKTKAKGKKQVAVVDDEEEEEVEEEERSKIEGRSLGLKDLIEGSDGSAQSEGSRRVVHRKSLVDPMVMHAIV